jgi:signal peptidase II
LTHRFFFLLAGSIFALDQLTKAIVNSLLPEGSSHALLPGVLMLTHIRNPGTAFGLMRGSGPLLTVITVAAVIFIISYWLSIRRQALPATLLAWGLALPLGGALGNLVDRVRLGHVIDFIDFRVWPVFNVADSAITVGACLVAYYFFFIQDARPQRLASAPAAELDAAPATSERWRAQSSRTTLDA